MDPVAPLESGTVVMVGGRIVEVTANPPECDDNAIIDGRGATLLPGFIDAHVHTGPGRLAQALMFGVTTEIDLFNDPAVVATLHRQAAEHSDVADLRSAGTGATAPGGHPTHAVEQGLVAPFPTVTRPDDALEFVTARVAEGSDLLKIFLEPGILDRVPVLEEATVAALVSASAEAGLVTVAHVTDATSARRAVRAGVDILGHIFCDRYDPDFAAFALAHRIAVIPTLVMFETLCGRSRADELAADPWIASRLDDISRATLAARWPAGMANWDLDVARSTVRELYDAGVTILAGSDAVNPGTAHGASLHRELELLVEAGLPPRAALRAATDQPARVFGLSDRGRIAPGYRSDLILVDGNPAEDISVTRRIRGVWRGGVLTDPRYPRTPTQ